MTSPIFTYSDNSDESSFDPVSLVELLRWRATLQANRLAYTFLEDGKEQEASLSYADLDRRARAIGAGLQSAGTAGERVLLLYPPGLEYIAAFFGCLYAKAVAVPAYPPRLNRNLDRLRAILADARPAVILTTDSILARMEPLIDKEAGLKTMTWLTTDDFGDELASHWRDPVAESHTLAFLQYTSGSTAKPKGVMVSHGNLLHNERMIQRAFQQSEQSIITGWLPLFHDMGLIGNVLQPLYVGARCILMSPITFLRSPLTWLEAISRYRATTSGGPNFAYDLCVRKLRPEHADVLDLSSWTVAFNGSEPVRKETMDRFAAAFEPYGFRREAFFPCYGLAEATLFVSGGLKMAGPKVRGVDRKALEQGSMVGASDKHDDGFSLVSCGRTFLEQRIVIADPASCLQRPPGHIGEIWVSGPNVAMGYWDRPEETAQTFQAYLADTGEGPFLRTGDLGVIADNELYVTGRLKDLIIIRGRNHYPQDIERTVEKAHPGLRAGGGAAFSIEMEAEERLVLVQEIERTATNLDVEQVAATIRQAIAQEHELQAYAVALIDPGSLPKTSSGKVQRHVCRSLFLEGKLEVVGSIVLDHVGEDLLAPLDENNLSRELLLSIDSDGARSFLLESFLRHQVASILRVDVSRLSLQQPLTSLGLDSLMAVELQHRVESGTGVWISLSDLFNGPSIAGLASDVLRELTLEPTMPLAVPHKAQGVVSEHRLSYGQQALWFLHQLAPQAATYSLSSAVRIRTALDIPALKQAFQHLVDRHASLRTTFNVSSGKPVQRIHPYQPVYFQHLDATNWGGADLTSHLEQEAHRPFDLEEGPLMRVTVYRRSATENILLLTVHHLVADFWSLEILINELSLLYAAERRGTSYSLPPLEMEYVDYVNWQAAMLTSNKGERDWAYWQQQLAGELPASNLPVDRPRPPVQTYRGASHAFKLNEQLTSDLKALAESQGVTLYTILLAAFQVLLHRCSGQEDILVGTPTASRNSARFAGLIGYFVNPVVLRADLSRKPALAVFLQQVRRTLIDALEHQDFPFALLAERLQPERNASRSPLFQVMFAWQKARLLNDGDVAGLALGEAGVNLHAGELPLESVALRQKTAQFELTLVMTQISDALTGSLQYNTDLFDASTIARMAGHLQTLLESFVVSPMKKVSELDILTVAEQKQILLEWNDQETGYPQNELIHEMIAAQAEHAPDSVAVIYEDEILTYDCLNRRANQLAHHLRSSGVECGDLIGICMHRSPEMLIGLLGILKSGCAYVPLDPTYPADRLSFMLKDAGVSTLVSQQELAPGLIRDGVRAICLDSDWNAVAQESCETPIIQSTPDQLAYVIYTSGSTGWPKGVMIEHRNVINFFTGMDDRIGCRPQDRLLAVTSISFDISVLEIFWTLARGAQVVLHSDQVNQDSIIEPESRNKDKALKFGLFYFASAEAGAAQDTYRLVFEGAKFADSHGFDSVWTPERHFHAFGGLYPNPSVMGAALAAVTSRVAIRAGSVVLPLHHPVRVAEEWSLVDNISKGRVGISIASGWHAHDFVFAPDNYADRKEVMRRNIDTVRRLWRGESVKMVGGSGSEVEVKILPRPIQPELPIWITAAGNPDTFLQAGQLGTNLLTHLLGQSLEQLAEKISLYRKSLAENGYDPQGGRVTLMLHTFIGESRDGVREKVREPFINYLRSSVDLIANLVKSLNLPLDMGRMSKKDLDDLLAFAFDRYYETSALFGTPKTCLAMIDRLKEIGVDEVACLVDFGVDVESVLAGLPYLNELKELAARPKRTQKYSLAAQARRCRPSLMQCTPSMLKLLGYTSEDLEFLNSLDSLMLGGEALPPALAEQVKRVLPSRLINMYGPTETTIWSATHEVKDAANAIPVGRPIANTQLYVLDRHLQPVPAGVSGELYIGGEGVARGYFNLPQLTAEKFIPAPFGKETGARIYATGDLARHRPDGNVEYLGRIDYQIKIRGFRVELEEIDARLGQHPKVREGVVIAQQDSSGGKRLIAYVVPDQDQSLDAGELRSFLKEHLPEYMVPAVFVTLQSLPLTSNGKINRKALPSPEMERPGSRADYIAPRSKLERTIAEIWQGALGIKKVGLHDNFFDLGGHSLLMAQVHSQLRDVLGNNLPLIKLLEHPTINSLARYLAQEQDDHLPLRQSQDRASQQREALKRQRQTAMSRMRQ